MNKFKLLFSLLLLSAFIFTNSQAITVDGKVKNSNTGVGIADAEVLAVLVNNGMWQDSAGYAVTNDQGLYVMQIENPGNYLFIVSHTDFRPGQFGPYPIEVDTTLHFPLIPRGDPQGHDLWGFVFDSFTNFPVGGALIQLQSLDGAVMDSTESNNMGKYYFDGVDDGTYLLFADKLGYQESLDTVVISGPILHNHFDIYLTPENATDPASLSGLVYFISDDSAEIPIGGVSVTLTHPILAITFQTESNNNGIYEFDNIPPGRYYLRAAAEGFGFFHEPPFILNSGPNEFDIQMYPITPPEFGVITGQVIFDNTNLPVLGARINFIPVDGGLAFFAQPHSYTDSSGFYEAELPAYDYYVMLEYYFDPAMLTPYIEFYDDVHNFQEATVVEVNPNQVADGINFGVPQPVWYNLTVEGNVTDSDGNPLDEALVKLFLTRDNAGIVSNDYRGLTNADGDYSITIENFGFMNNSLIAMAKKPGYLKEFYDNKPEMFLADVITINATGDTTITGIDFSLDSMGTVSEYSISGNVTSLDGAVLPGTFVAAFGLNTGQFGFALTDNTGDYSIGNLLRGTYYVLFYNLGFAPQFYDNAMIWEDADPIELFSDVDGINAALIPLSDTLMPGSISGNIVANSGGPLSGVMVAVTNSNDEVVSYSMTNAQGEYSLEGLGTNEYTVIATKVNYQSQSQDIAFDLGNGTSQTINFNMPTGVTDVDGDSTPEIPSSYSLENNYPNPFNPTTNISFSLPEAGYVKLTVFNTIGQEVAELVNNTLDAGIHNVTFNADELNSGIYFYRIESGSFINTKKMILIK